MQQQRFRGLVGTAGMRAGRLYRHHDSNIGVYDYYTHHNKTQNVYDGSQTGIKVQPQCKVFAAEIWHGDRLVLETDKAEEIGAQVKRAYSPYDSSDHSGHLHCDNVSVSERKANGNIPLRRHGREGQGGHSDSDARCAGKQKANNVVYFHTVDGKYIEHHCEQELQRVAEQQMTEQDVARAAQQEGLTQQGKHHQGIDIEEEEARQHTQQSLGRVITQRLVHEPGWIHFLRTHDTQGTRITAGDNKSTLVS